MELLDGEAASAAKQTAVSGLVVLLDTTRPLWADT